MSLLWKISDGKNIGWLSAHSSEKANSIAEKLGVVLLVHEPEEWKGASGYVFWQFREPLTADADRITVEM